MPFLKLLRWVPGWLWAVIALVIATFLLWGHIQGLGAERDEAIGQLETSRLEVAVLESALQWRREEAARQLQALEAREAELQRIRAEHSQQLEALEQLEKTDEETADWASVAVPGAVRDWMRQLSGEVSSTDRDGPGSTRVSVEATSRTEASD
ncbi:hypothetical protein EHLJMEHL_02202 [Vreelandella titanicae]